MNTRTITPEDLYALELVSSLEISPDGDYVIYAQQRVDRESEKKYSNLYRIRLRDGEIRPFTVGDQVDHSPRWSPDGSQIAFLSNRQDEKQFQIYLIPSDGGEARPLTDLKGQFGAFEWSPDGSRIAFQFRKKDAEDLAREKDEKKKKLGVVARHIDRLTYKYDGEGFLPKERWHIWVLDVESGEAKQLTNGMKYHETNPTWTPDGETILFTSNRSADPDIDYDLIDIYAIPVAGGEMIRLPAPDGPKQMPSVSPDGKWVAYYGDDQRGTWWRNNRLWVIPFDDAQGRPFDTAAGEPAEPQGRPLDGSALARDLTGKFDFDVNPSVINDVNGGAVALIPPVWSPDSRRLYFPVARHGSSQLHSISLEGDDLQTHTPVPGTVGKFSFDRAGQKMAYFFATMQDPGQIFLLEDGQARQLTHLNAWLDEVDLGEVEEVWFKGRDDNDLQGWILKPPGFDPSRKYPSILEIHGGPRAQYGHFFMHEFYYLAAQGYVVYFCNPRGGQGYGEAHTKAIHGDWGNADYADLMIWADYVQALPYIDPERRGVTGGSYGGYMTLWIIGHTHQFKAAVAQRVVSNFISFWGSSDMNWLAEHLTGDPAPFKDLQTAWDHSPAKYLPNAKTPTLIIHSEQDHRCPIEQGEQAFVLLKVNGVETEMVRFPDEPHGLSRTGRTDRRIARLQHIVRWMDKYLDDRR